jgi:hypothetical protein
VTTKSTGNKQRKAQPLFWGPKQGSDPEVSCMAVETPALVWGQHMHVVVRPGNEPCICRSVCFTRPLSMAGQQAAAVSEAKP